MKQPAVLLAVRLLHFEKTSQVDRILPRRQRIPADRVAVARDIARGVVIILGEGDADRHVQQMPDGAAGIDRGRQFRHVVDDSGVRVEQAAVRQNAAERAADRLADRKHDVRRGGAHAVAVPFRRNPSAPEHDERIGIGGAQRVANRGRLAVVTGKTDMADVFETGLEQNCVAGRRDIGGRHQPPDIAKTPGAERRLAPVSQRHQPVRRRRKAVHKVIRSHVFSPYPGFRCLSAIRTILGES